MSSSPPKTETCRVSLILPVYNVAAYIRDCLRSIVAQSFAPAFEAILVDDCSTDDSAAICREFVARYPRIFRLVECASNGGVSVARNLGLEQAGGDYLMFVDPDDLLPPTALSTLVEAAEQKHADIVKGNLTLFDGENRRPAPDRVRRSRLLRGDEVLSELFEHSEVRGHVGGKLCLREKFAAVRFTAGVGMAQDLLYFSEVFAAADSLLLVDREVYEYRKHGTGSTGRKYEKGTYIDWLGAVEASGKFATTRRQQRAHKKLLLRTMTQIARECRDIPAENATAVLAVIEQKCRHWRLGLLHMIAIDRLGLRSIGRYLKFRLALRRIRRGVSGS
jgi:glycosyltransferase involved in cell wall biosynthesis